MVPESEHPVVGKALAKEPADRFPDCRSFVQALESAARSEVKPPTPSPSPTLPQGRSRRLVRLGFLVLAACLAGGGLLWFLSRDRDSLTQLRHEEIRREVALLLADPPSAIRVQPPDTQVVKRFEPADLSAFEVLSDERVVDLRLWKEVPADQTHELLSAVTMTRRVRLKKTKQAGEYSLENRTTGLDLFMACLSPYPFRMQAQKGDTFVGTDRMKARKLIVDVSTVPEGSEFDLRTASTFWNSLQTEQEQWFGIIGHEKAFKVSQLLLFPTDRPFRSISLMLSQTIREPPAPYTGPKILLTDPNRSWVYWEVPSPEAGCVYRLHWKW
jgi:hypothetical protein